MKITVNNTQHEIAPAQRDTPLLWVLREELGLVGTKFGCGIGTCGACTVHIDGKAARACQLTPDDVIGAHITTIEGLAASWDPSDNEDSLHPVQDAWVTHSVPQCGYCQAGQIMAASALLLANPTPDDREIEDAMSGNLCRCGTYVRIRAAIRDAAESM